MKVYSRDVRNAIDSLNKLHECLYEDEDYCGVATVESGIFYLEVFYIGLYSAEKLEEEK